MNQLDRPDSLINRGIKLSHLRLLEALDDCGQISDAARRLGMAQPAASRLLAEIERIVGRPVHERTGRGVVLTPVGSALALRARRIHTELRDAARDVAEIDTGLVGHVRVGSVTGPALDRVLPAIRAARMVQPKVTYEVIVATSDVLCQSLLSGRIDFAIGRLPVGPERHLLSARMIAPEPVSLMVRKGHPLLRMMPVEAAALMDYDWVMPGPESLLCQTVLSRLRALGLPEPTQRFSTASFLLTLALIQQSNAIAPLAQAVCNAFTQGPDAPYRVIGLDLGIEVEPFGFITRIDTILTPAASRMAQMLMGGDS
jgi:molybdate transport repressor ModE-like protein